MTKTASLVAVLLLVGVATAWASDDTADRETLRGLKGIGLRIEPLEPEIERDGLATSQLRADAELRLRQAEIPVSERLEYLFVNVNMLKTGAGYIYAVTMKFEQPVTIPRSDQSASAVTWSPPGVLGIVPVDLAPQKLRDVVGKMVDNFIDAYRSVNPKP